MVSKKIVFATKAFSKHMEYDLSASSSTDSSPRVTDCESSNDSPSPKRNNDDLRRSIHRANSPSPRSADNSPRNDSERKKKLFEELLKKKKRINSNM